MHNKELQDSIKILYFIFLFQVIRYKQNVVKHDATNEIICPDGTAFLQFVADNTDHDLATLNGKNTHHGIGSIAIANGNFSNVPVYRQRIPRDKKEPWSQVVSTEGIKIIQYIAPSTPSLTKVVLQPIAKVIKFLFMNY